MADSESTLSGFYVDELMGMMPEQISDERDRSIFDIDISEYLRDNMFFTLVPVSRAPSMPVSNVSGHEELKVVGVDEESRADDDCAVCLEKLFDEERKDQAVVKETPCGHRFHDKCIEQWLGMRSSCPLCRFEMPRENEDEEAIIRQQIMEARPDVQILQHLLMNF